MSTILNVVVKMAVPVVKKAAGVSSSIAQEVGIQAGKVGEDIDIKVGDAIDWFELDVTLARNRFAMETKCKELEQK